VRVNFLDNWGVVVQIAKLFLYWDDLLPILFVERQFKDCFGTVLGRRGLPLEAIVVNVGDLTDLTNLIVCG
jgi:hypothetical protein